MLITTKMRCLSRTAVLFAVAGFCMPMQLHAATDPTDIMIRALVKISFPGCSSTTNGVADRARSLASTSFLHRFRPGSKVVVYKSPL